jgi:hypothetical protein
MPRLRATDSGQVYNVDIPELRVTRDTDGIYVLHGRGHFMTFPTREEAFEHKREIEAATGGGSNWIKK